MENYLTVSKEEIQDQNTKFEVLQRNQELIFKLNTIISDPYSFKIPFQWEFHCDLMKDSAKFLKDEIIEPSLMLLSLFDDERLEFLVKDVILFSNLIGERTSYA